MVSENVCLYRKFGHCKYSGTCKFRHIETICENMNCDIESCEKRHPRDCRFFSDFARCKFGEYCSFKHRPRSETNLLNVEIDNLKAKVENLEKLVSEKDKQIQKILNILENMTVEKDVTFKHAIVNDEIECEKFSENSHGDKAEKAREKIDPEQNSTFPCKECGEIFKRENNLNEHMKSKHPVIYPCDVCWLLFETERGMKNHMRSLHQPTT